MIHELTVFNLPSGEKAFPAHLNAEPWMEWSTCVRQMRIGFKDWIQPEQKHELTAYSGVEAYKYLLEVICGLHSPMLGETEVLGQFRDRVLTAGAHPRFSKLFKTLIGDAKSIRQQHLMNLGANSYGSLTRKYTREFNEIAILGSGKLTADILPWLKSKALVEVYSRHPLSMASRFAAFPNVKVLGLDQLSQARVVVVAAPVETKWLGTWIKNQFNTTSLVLDLRDNSSREPLAAQDWSIRVLQDFFLELNSNQDQIRSRIDLAKKEIQKFSEERLKTQEIRPFGWDDICA